MLLAGAKKRRFNREGFLPLHLAALKGWTNIVALLLQTDSDLQVNSRKNKLAATPLQLAAHNGHPAVVKQLLSVGAKIDKPNKKGTTPLHFAVRGGHLEVVIELLQNHANKEAQDNDQKTPLDYATGRPKIVACFARY